MLLDIHSDLERKKEGKEEPLNGVLVRLNGHDLTTSLWHSDWGWSTSAPPTEPIPQKRENKKRARQEKQERKKRRKKKRKEMEKEKKKKTSHTHKIGMHTH